MTAPSSIARWKVFLPNGELPLTYRRWYSVTWDKLLLQAYASVVMPPQEKTNLWVNTLSMHRVKTLLPEYAHRNKSPKSDHSAGPSWPVFLRPKGWHTILLWKKLCLKSTWNSMQSRPNWKTITKICRTWNLPYRKVN